MGFHSPSPCQRRGSPSCFPPLCLFSTILCLHGLQTVSRRKFIPSTPIQNTACEACILFPPHPLFSFPLFSTLILGDTEGVSVTDVNFHITFLPFPPCCSHIDLTQFHCRHVLKGLEFSWHAREEGWPTCFANIYHLHMLKLSNTFCQDLLICSRFLDHRTDINGA